MTTPVRPLDCPSSLALISILACSSPLISRADQVIADDLIVQSSIAAGFDAANGESFGFDTLRLKENNLRIHFDDTSTSAGYAANDWRLMANDSVSGGANYFAIEDSTAGKVPFRVDAGAPADALRIVSSGRIGIGTSDPGLHMEIKKSDTPAMRLAQDNTGGFTAQSWDMGGNEANFFIRDVTGGSKLCFRVRPGAPTSSIDIAASGNVGIGTASPQAKLHVTEGTVLVEKKEDPFVSLKQTGIVVDNITQVPAQTWDMGGDEENFFVRDTTGGNTLPFRIRSGAPTSSVDVAASGNVGIGTASPLAKLHVAGNALVTGTLEIGSSRTLKEDIRDLGMDEAKEAFDALKPVHFKYKTDSEQQLGFIAEDVPDLVATNSRKSLVPMDFVAVLTKVVQQHDSRVQELEKKLSARDEAIEALTARLNALEQGTTTHVSNSTVSEEMRQARRAERRDPVDSATPAPVIASRPQQETTPEVIDNGR